MPETPSIDALHKMGSHVTGTQLARMETGIHGLDLVLNGGLIAGSVVIVAGSPGTGKTTLGNQLVYHHAETGGTAVFVTAMAESHDRMLAHLHAFGFFNAELVGTRILYLSVLDALVNGGLDRAVEMFREAIRETNATLLVLDGVSMLEALAPSALEVRRFTNQLQVLAALLNCTILLLSNAQPKEVNRIGTHADGIIILRKATSGTRAVRLLEVVKLRGSDHLDGRHEFDVTDDGIVVFPRLEGAFAGSPPPSDPPVHRLGFGLEELDAMTGGGFIAGSSTLIAGTPGAGKTLSGLHFAVDGARRGERVLIAGFHESPERLARTADGVGLEFRRHLEKGRVRIVWRSSLEISPDAWAWDLLAAVRELKPQRLVVDAFTDVERRLLADDRAPDFVAALTNELREAGVTSLLTAELSSVTAPEMRIPLPSASPAFDNIIVLRRFELRSRLRRMVSVLKMRESSFDPAIREFVIDDSGITVGNDFEDAAGILTGAAVPMRGHIS